MPINRGLPTGADGMFLRCASVPHRIRIGGETDAHPLDLASVGNKKTNSQELAFFISKSD